jgi:SAM-dependent methyltransferase
LGDHELVFGAAASWRADAALDLGLQDDALIGALSPAVCVPVGLTAFLDRMHPGCVVVDVGAGLCGVTEWVRRTTGASVLAVEPQHAARHAARRVFPHLDVIPGSADDTGLRAGTFDGVLLCGVVSLLDRLDPVLDEASRLLRTGGALAVVDLFAASPVEVHSPPNTFRSVESVMRALQDASWHLLEVGIGRPETASSWWDGARRASAWIADRHAGEPAYEAWQHDQRALAELIDAGRVTGGAIVVRRTPG